MCTFRSTVKKGSWLVLTSTLTSDLSVAIVEQNLCEREKNNSGENLPWTSRDLTPNPHTDHCNLTLNYERSRDLYPRLNSSNPQFSCYRSQLTMYNIKTQLTPLPPWKEWLESDVCVSGIKRKTLKYYKYYNLSIFSLSSPFNYPQVHQNPPPGFAWFWWIQ